jgi:hypothetical protein
MNIAKIKRAARTLLLCTAGSAPLQAGAVGGGAIAGGITYFTVSQTGQMQIESNGAKVTQVEKNGDTTICTLATGEKTQCTLDQANSFKPQ